MPDAPTSLEAQAGNEAVRLSWTAPVGGGRVSGYEYRQSEDGGSTWNPDWTDIPNSAPGEANAAAYTVPDLTNGTTYTFEVRAENVVGHGAEAARASATPSAVDNVAPVLTAAFRGDAGSA